MNATSAAGVAAPPRAAGTGWLPLHQRLMPDYNRPAALYWWAVVLLGLAVLLHSLAHLAGVPPAAWVHVAAGTLLAMLAGLVPVRIPRSTNSFTAGEIFIFLLLLLDGAQAAALASACEALVGSWRSSKRWTSRIASPAMAALAMFTAGSALHAALDALRRHGMAADGVLIAAAVCFAIAYFVLNTVMVTMVGRLKRNEPLRLRAFVDSFGWLGVAYAGNASVATFLYLSFRSSGIAVVVAAVPIIVILLVTGHFYFRREEAEEAVRKAREQQAAQRQMLENARQAGMAEIATNVLHNVGNVLTSVNVSAELICNRVRASEAAGLPRAVRLLDEHAHDLGEFLTRDAKGRLLPEYLRHLAQALMEERGGLLQELESLTLSVKHIKEIVATQQSYAGASSVVEAIQVRDLLEDALRINTVGAGDRAPAVVREFADVPQAMLDKHRVLLILVNLIRNATQAMAGMVHVPHVLRLSLGVTEKALLIVVEDSGEGIAPENLTRIFAHGFTTKKDGHGFGLHSCALAAREMGGALTAHSDGPGRGARFTLELPFNIPPETTA
ncbi:MAG TPA: HAMP domain-containing sensor histidine kinase [Burkholderiales bacterium]|nr:HAMP domain-containing sensor histidine kinase [Burkholderiales bacterium]